MSPEEMEMKEPRWRLVQEVVASSLFEKSPRLRAFLLYVAEMELSGRRQEINEQHIGTHVFGRASNYNPGDDSIVRSQARFLRQRLTEYFATAGAGSAMVIEIPKGSYAPVFVEREMAPAEVAAVAAAPVGEDLPEVKEDVTPKKASRQKVLSRIWVGAFGAIVLALLVALGVHLAHKGDASSRFWASFFDPRRTQIIVPADSTLILVEEITGQEVSFPSYLAREYLTKGELETGAPKLDSGALANSHYTSMADLRLVARLYHLPQMETPHTQIRYARELSLSDAREDNLLLIGGSRANPWVTLFSPQMNFSVDYDAKSKENRVTNRSPQKGEESFYRESAADGAVYGLVAYEPSLDKQGHVLMVAGTSSAGTQTAADFLLSKESLDGFLKKIETSDGRIPHFEVLLEGHSLNGNAMSSTIVAYRLLAN